ncbi:MAG: biotin--[acetyl-CoA-carboxylase] ligase [Bacteroidetes bacterium]|nr:biotin--[acetyl-CoA-carboxylase] ligase [Bacteroidia bacterium]PCH68727.1 MAG: biotin--[acetyl-CoA-carboxylase] ligase [Bacteroidota bacterium]
MDKLFFGSNTIELEQVDSTNTYAMKLANDANCVEGTVINTKLQTEGKGQREGFWESASGQNLTFSCIVKPSFLSASEQFNLNKAVSLGIYDYVNFELDASNFQNEVTIKWPNDIYVSDKKISGILIENIIAQSKIKSSVIGIGINVNQTSFATMIPNAISIKGITQNTVDLHNALNSCLKYLEIRYLQLRNGNTEALHNDYMKNLYKHNTWHDYKTPDGKITGKIIDITPFGKLVVKNKAGRSSNYDFKEIQYL